MNSDVYFIRSKKFEPLEKLLKRVGYLFFRSNICSGIKGEDFAAIKIHCGEDTNTTAVNPKIIDQLGRDLQKITKRVFITDTNVLYQSDRKNAVEHLLLMQKRGFGLSTANIPVIIADGLYGSNGIEVKISKKHYTHVNIATEIAMANAMLIVSHPTGHVLSGYGGAIKNLGMGCATRKGKLQMHTKIFPAIKAKKCVACGICLKWCPQEAISLMNEKAQINDDKCVGCGQCLTVCRYDAVKFSWKIDPSEFQERIVEYALGAMAGKENKLGFVNILMDITKDCDCIRQNQIPIVEDIGVLASTDPVAIDTASLYLIKEKNNKRLRDLAYDIDYTVQLKYAQELEMGNIDFSLIEID